VEKQSYKDLLSKVGIYKSRISSSTPAQGRNGNKEDVEKTRRQSPEASSRNDRSKSRYSKRSAEKQCESPDRHSFERLELKADLKDMVGERLKSRKRQDDRRSASIEKSYERYRDQSFDNRESTIKRSMAT
jgi:hypothetical protein